MIDSNSSSAWGYSHGIDDDVGRIDIERLGSDNERFNPRELCRVQRKCSPSLLRVMGIALASL